MQFRVRLSLKRSRSGRALSAKTINVVMRVPNALLAEATDRHRFENPGLRIKRLKVQKRDIDQVCALMRVGMGMDDE